jgi:hypothetical protein
LFGIAITRPAYSMLKRHLRQGYHEDGQPPVTPETLRFWTFSTVTV